MRHREKVAHCATAWSWQGWVVLLASWMCGLLPVPAHGQSLFVNYAQHAAESRQYHTATLLGDGRVLVVGGQTHASGPYTQLYYAEIYDPGRDAWTPAGGPTWRRMGHCAVPLRGGGALVIGGELGLLYSDTTERYDPGTNEWMSAASMAVGRAHFTATVLKDGRVIAVGGRTALPPTYDAFDVDSVEIYDAAADRWTVAAPLSGARSSHAATLLRDGRLLVTGGWRNGVALATAEVFDPASGTWSLAANMPVAYAGHAATLLANGKVMVTGGEQNSDLTFFYDPATNQWSLGPRNVAIRMPTATLLPDGRVLVIGASGTTYQPTPAWHVLNPATQQWAPVAGLTLRTGHTATLLGSGVVFVMGGTPVYPMLGAAAQVVFAVRPTWSTAGQMQAWRISPSLTLLPSGKVLIAGGSSNPAMETFDPTGGTLTAVGVMPRPRDQFTAKLLRSGKVLMAGGRSGSDYVRDADLYDPATGQWNGAGALQRGREGHSTTMLADGRVLIAGGQDAAGLVASVEIFDPGTNAWSAAGSLQVPRYDHSATLLPDGRVLIAGGRTDSGMLGAGEVFDPRTMTFALADGMILPRSRHDAVLLPDGRVRVLAGEDPTTSRVAEVFDPLRNAWSHESGVFRGRANARATLLASDDVLVTGGLAQSGLAFEPVAELAARNSIVGPEMGTMAVPRAQHGAVQLLDGRVLVVGGVGASGVTQMVESFHPAPVVPAARRPAIAAVQIAALPGAIRVTGTGLAGDSEAGSGNAGHSAANVPVLRLQRLDGDATMTLSGASFSDTVFTSMPLRTAAKGWYALRVIVDGIASDAVVIAIDGVTPGPWPSATSLAVAATSSIVAGGAPATLVATVEGVAPAGTVTFYDGEIAIGGCRDVPLAVGPATATATCFTGALGAGAHALSARYAGDSAHFASRSSSVSVQVQPPRADCSVQMDRAEVLVNEGAPYAVVTATRTGFCPEPVNFAMSLHDIDAGLHTIGFGNFLPQGSDGTPANWAVTVFVSELPGSAPRSFRVDLENVENARLGSPASTVVRITDRNNPPVAMPTGGRIVRNPYGVPKVTGAGLAGDQLVGLTSHVVIELGSIPGSAGSSFEIDFDTFTVGAGNSLEVRAGAPGQTVVLRNKGSAPASIAGIVNGALLHDVPTVLHLASPAGITIPPGGFLGSWTGLIVDSLGANWSSGGPIRNDGTIWGPTALTLMGASVTGNGSHIAGAFNLYTFGNANNPTHGSFFLENGLRVYPPPGGFRVPVTIAAYGSAPQFINLAVNGDATLLMPSSWPAGVNLPRNHRPVAPGESIPNFTPPAYGGGGIIVQVSDELTLLGGASNDLVIPGALVLKAGRLLDVGGVTLNNGWTSTGQTFQGVFLESPIIVNNGGAIRVYTNDLNWINFSSFPRAAVETWQLVKPSSQAYFKPANGIAPHLNSYSTSIEMAARGECWTCVVNPMPFP